MRGCTWNQARHEGFRLVKPPESKTIRLVGGVVWLGSKTKATKQRIRVLRQDTLGRLI
jgi:hypothetical protein